MLNLQANFYQYFARSVCKHRILRGRTQEVWARDTRGTSWRRLLVAVRPAETLDGVFWQIKKHTKVLKERFLIRQYIFSSVPRPIALSGGHEGRFRRDPLPGFFLQEALVSSSGMGRDVYSLTLSIQHFLCRPRRRPPSKVPWSMVLKRLSWCVTRSNRASFRLSTVCQKRFMWTYKEVDLAPQD